MEHHEFLKDMARLTDRFGTKRYPREVCQEIWNECAEHSSHWFSNLITRFISTKSIGPLAIEFKQSSLSEKKRKQAGNTSSSRPHPSETSVFSLEERAEMFEIMKRAANGIISREDALKYAEMVEASLRAKGVHVLDWKRQHPITLEWDDTLIEPPEGGGAA